MYDELEREVGLKLPPNHCYTLVGCAQRGGEQYVAVKNPHNKSQQVAGPRATGAGGRAAGGAKAPPASSSYWAGALEPRTCGEFRWHI